MPEHQAFHTVKSVAALDDLWLMAVFEDGESRYFDVSGLVERFGTFRALADDRQLFESVQVAPGGYGIVWNDDIDLSCESLYFDGVASR